MEGLLVILLLVPLGAGIAVGLDAKRRGLRWETAALWGIGVWAVLIIFLPAWLILRPSHSPVIYKEAAYDALQNGDKNPHRINRIIQGLASGNIDDESKELIRKLTDIQTN